MISYMHTIPSSVINVFILASGQYVFTVLNSKVNVTSSSLLEIIQATGHPTQYNYVVLTYSYNNYSKLYHCEIHLQPPMLLVCACTGLSCVLNQGTHNFF